ncbi:hypothetical protein J2Z23_003558 [Lederbergia galactosidilyticus]|uniref:hypothetical protein n=1 Tax=Lederbergia galactosidilytica TaxID=217031 RepID=UPI001AE4CA83|nr:hypothetical protein [Lederbergia galactosidilytica]MBP1916576.1 hypothetical protein [Lederbergia galactosidilytica]
MDYMSLAIEAKRKKDFELAHKYYGAKMEQDGITAGLLRSISKIFYLEKQNYTALMFALAATHLSLFQYLQEYKNGDLNVKQALEVIPNEIIEQFPHPIGALLMHEPNTLKHIAHSYADQEEVYKDRPAVRMYAEVYYVQVLGDGSHVSKLEEFRLTPEEHLNYEENEYIPLGITIIKDQIKWSEIDNPDVSMLYLV